LLVKKDRGERLGRPPLRLPRWGRRADALRARAACASAGGRVSRGRGWTLARVVDELKAQGFRNSKGRPFALSAVHRMEKHGPAPACVAW